VGEVTARALIRTYPTLDALEKDARAQRARAGPLRGTPHLKARVREAAEYLAAMREVVPIRTDLDLSVVEGKRDDALLERLAKRWNIKGPAGRLTEALDAKGTVAPRR
jgi:hypothetical protein